MLETMHRVGFYTAKNESLVGLVVSAIIFEMNFVTY